MLLLVLAGFISVAAIGFFGESVGEQMHWENLDDEATIEIGNSGRLYTNNEFGFEFRYTQPTGSGFIAEDSETSEEHLLTVSFCDTMRCYFKPKIYVDKLDSGFDYNNPADPFHQAVVVGTSSVTLGNTVASSSLVAYGSSTVPVNRFLHVESEDILITLKFPVVDEWDLSAAIIKSFRLLDQPR